MVSRAQPVQQLAIACQGGGSHTAFTGGVLERLLESSDTNGEFVRGDRRYRLRAVSGTSGGALCAYLFWLEWLARRTGRASVPVQTLRRFWTDTAARPWPAEPVAGLDLWTNQIAVAALRAQDLLPMPAARPTVLSGLAQRRLRDGLAAFDTLRPQVSALPADLREDPRLIIGAINVIDSNARPFVFAPDCPPMLDALIASTALPPLFDPVLLNGDPMCAYWDGVLSQNPPLREFFSGRSRQDKPDAIWLVRINPVTLDALPSTGGAQRDRYNELLGNVALAQELATLQDFNELAAEIAMMRGSVPGRRLASIKPVQVEEIVFDEARGAAFDDASKLDRSPAWIARLFAAGRAAAERFLAADSASASVPRQARLSRQFSGR